MSLRYSADFRRSRLVHFASGISKLVEEIHRTSAKQIIQADRGMVTAMSSLVTIKVPCEFNMGRFPYDMHNCSVFIGPWKEHLSQYKIGKNLVLSSEKDTGNNSNPKTVEIMKTCC